MRALLLDLDGTLLDHRAAADLAVLTWAAELVPAERVPCDLAAQWTALEDKHVPMAERGEVSWQEQRRARLRDLFTLLELEPGDDAALDGQFADFLRHYAASWQAYDDVAGAFAAWRAEGVRIGVLTNGVRAQQEQKLAALGVTGDLEFVVALDDLGFGKPDARAYAAACDAFGLPPDGVVYVGDDLERDALGAQRAGLTGVWLDRLGQAPHPDVRHVITSLDEVLPLLSLSTDRG